MSDVRVIYKLDTLEKMKEQGVSKTLDAITYQKSNKLTNASHKLLCICRHKNGISGMSVRYQDYFDILDIDGFDSPIYYEIDLDSSYEVEYAKQIQLALDEFLDDDYIDVITYPSDLSIDEYMHRADLFDELQRQFNELLQFKGLRTV